MLSARLAPSFVKYAQLRYASYQPVLMQSIAVKLSPCQPGREPNRSATSAGVNHASFARSSSVIAHRSYSTQPSLPTKNEVEKVFFKVTVVIWDLMFKTIMWSWAMFRKYVMLNTSVQSYWRNFNQKLEEARKH